MSLPTTILKNIYDHYQAADWCIITLNNNNEIIHFNTKAHQDLNINDNNQDIRSVLPLLATESLDEVFYIPFYNHDQQIFDVHFNIDDQQQNKYLIMVPVDMMHEKVQFKQQKAHEQVIEKLRLQELFTTLEDAHAELKEANTAKSFYISALSHEIGNPLNVIKGYNQLLKDGSVTAENATKIIDRNVLKLEQIISQSIDYDMEQTKQYNALFKPADLINEQFNDFRLQANNKNLTLNNHVDTDIILGSNKNKWNQIFTNLISNAIKYTDAGNITISSSFDQELLHIDVCDTGCGMSPSFQKQLFTAWSRENKSSAQGKGIGLVISKMLAEQVNANLLLQSSGSQGSCFRFTVNYSQPQKPLKILLVDDDLDCLNLFEHYLTQVGHHVKTADSMRNLKKYLQDQPFDALITDLNLSDGQVHQIYPEIKAKIDKIIIITANPTDEIIEKLEHAGFDQVLPKPLTQEQLVNSVA